LEPAALRDAMVRMGMEPGWNQSLDRLADLQSQFINGLVGDGSDP